LTMTERFRQVHVVVVGSTNFDLVAHAERLPREGEVLTISNLGLFAGGKGANRAVAASRLGARATLIGAVGADILGDFLVQSLESNGIDITLLKRDPSRTTGCSFIALMPSGNNASFVDPAANLCLRPSDIERAKELIEQADALCCDLEVPLETVEAALGLARKAGKLSVLDAGPPRYCPREVLELADVASPNQAEIESMTGCQVSGRDSAREAAQKLLELGARTVVLKLGSDGSMLVTRSRWGHFPAPKVQALDPTAAGDAFTAALTVKLADGTPIEQAITYANFAGALAVTKLGAQPSLPTRDEIEVLRSGVLPQQL
jgi:ribokinase